MEVVTGDGRPLPDARRRGRLFGFGTQDGSAPAFVTASLPRSATMVPGRAAHLAAGA